MSNFKDLTGQRFGRLTVIKRVANYIRPSGKEAAKWLCACDCGNEIEAITNALTSGSVQSCGCLHKERTSATFKKYNEYDLSGEYGIGYTSRGEEFYFDLEDYNKIKNYCWFVDSRGYISARYNNKQHILFHRLLFPDSITVDHITHNIKDNRKCNLRIATQSQNNINRGIMKNNTSGVTGVYWHKKEKRWVARIRVNKKLIYLGSFVNFDDAVKARKDGEEKYFGEYSYDNSMKAGETFGDISCVS